MAGILSLVGEGSTWTGGKVGFVVDCDSLVGRAVAMGWGALGVGAEQALKSKANRTNRINLNFMVFSLEVLTIGRNATYLLRKLSAIASKFSKLP